MRWAVLLLKIPDNWITQLLQEHDVRIRVFGCRPYGSQGGMGIVRIGSKENLNALFDIIRRRREVMRASFSHISEKSAMGEVVLEKCAACTALRQSECFMLSSKSCCDGRLEWTVAGENNSAIHDLMDLLQRNRCEVELREISACSGNLGLTERQEEILFFAYTSGYFEYPKRIRLKELSGIFDISLSALSEILRAGQRRIFSEYFRV